MSGSSKVPHVRPGQPIRISARAWNAIADATNAHRERSLAELASRNAPAAGDQPADIILVRNESSLDRDRFDVLGISSPIIAPTDNEDEFKNRVVLAGVTPAGKAHRGRFVILQEPIASGAIGRACIAGVTVARIHTPPETSAIYTADVSGTETEYLEAIAGGAAQILWRELDSGTVLALVRIGPPARGPFFGKVSTIYDEAGTYWTDIHVDGFISHVSANPCNSLGGDCDSTTYVMLKASRDCKVADIGYAHIVANDVVAWLPPEPTALEPVPGGMGTFDGYIVPHAGVGGAWLSLYAQKPYYEYVTGGGTPSVNTLMFNRLSILVGWYDNASVWHGIDGHPEPDPGDVTRIP